METRLLLNDLFRLGRSLLAPFCRPSTELRSTIRSIFPILLATTVLGTALTRLSATEYAVQSWRAGYGLEARGMDCCAIGRDGSVWIGAIGDLIRFDGLRFTRVPFDLSSSLAGNRISALWVDGNQDIWCGYETGELVDYNSNTGRARLLPLEWERQPVRAIARDPTGDLWILLNDHSLVRVRDGWTTGPHNIGGDLRFLTTKSGRFLAERAGGVFEWHPGGKWQPVDETFGYLYAVCPSRKEGYWLLNIAQERAYHVGDGGFALETRVIPPQVSSYHFLETLDGSLIAAVDGEGIVNMDPNGSVTTYGVNDGLASSWILQMVEDADGTIVAISSDGVSILRAKEARLVPGLGGLGDTRVMGIAGDEKGGLWIATEGKGLFHYADGALRSSKVVKEPFNPYLWSLLDAGVDGVLAGSWGGGLESGVNGQVGPAEGWDGTQHKIVTALIRASDGSIWAGTGDGIGQMKDGKWTWYLRCGDQPIRDVRCLAAGEGGRVWFGTNGQGAGYIQASKARFLGPDLEPDARFVTAIHGDGAGGVWIGTEGSGLLDWRDGRWTHLLQGNGLPCDDVFHIDDDGRGTLWFTSSVGVYAISKESLEALVDGRASSVQPLLINDEDGLPSTQCMGGTANAAYLDSKGNYYIPTTGGLAVIDTRTIRRRDSRLWPTITQVAIDGRPVAVRRGQPLVLRPATQSIRVQFTAPTLTHPSLVNFEYRLDSIKNSDWVSLGESRDLLLQRMAPGTHRLEIRAGYPGTLATAIPIGLDLRQMPTLFESVWFRVVLWIVTIAGLVVLIWSLVRRRYVIERRRLELESAVEQERRRISRDIHDDLGARLTQVMLLSQVGDRMGPDDGRKTIFGRIHSTAKAVTKALDELVWTVNPVHDTVEDFALYVARIAQEMITEAGVRCRIRIPHSLSTTGLNAGARHHLLMCMKEAIANAITHAHCEQIDVRLEVDDARLRLTVRDDGRGFEVESCAKGSGVDPVHSGCCNMRERMKEIGGTINLTSRPGKGTEVSFEYHL